MISYEWIKLFDENTDNICDIKNIKKDAIRSCTNYTKEEIKKWLDYVNNDKKPLQNESIFLYTKNSKARGFISIDKNENIWKVWNLFILRAYQNRWYGSVLLKKAESELLKSVDTIQVRATLNAQNFYLRNGYKYMKDQISRVWFPIVLLEKKT